MGMDTGAISEKGCKPKISICDFLILFCMTIVFSYHVAALVLMIFPRYWQV